MTEFKGKQQLFNKLRRLPDSVQDKVKAATLQGAEMIADDARNRVPVRSGKLKRSIKARRSEKNEFGAVAGSDEFYSRFVEFGTQKTTAQPFLFPAFKANRKRVMDNVRRSVKTALKHVAGSR